MTTYNEIYQDILTLGCKEILADEESFNKLLLSVKYPYKIPMEVKAACGHIITTSVYNLEKKIKPYCEDCEQVDFDVLYENIMKKFIELSVELKTTKDEIIEKHMTLRDSLFRVIMPKCNHERAINCYELSGLTQDKRWCVSCARIKKNNGRFTYEKVYEKFQNSGCTLITTKEEYENNHMSSKSEYTFKAKCSHEKTGKYVNLDFSKNIYCAANCPNRC